MIKVMLVDDEPFIRVAIKALFDWEDNGFEIVEEANNGESALLKLKYVRPDLIITDIKMPIRDGIELIREVGRLYPQTKCVVLSNYDDFELTRSAFLEGAIDYILKNDLTKANFSALAQRLKKNVFHTEQIHPESENQAETLRLPGLRVSLIRDLIANEPVSDDQFSAFSGSLPYVICAIKKDSYLRSIENASVPNNDTTNIVKNTILKIISEISEFETYCCVDSADKYILMVCCGGLEEPSFFEKLDAFLHSLCTNILLYINSTPTVGVSGLETEIKNLRRTYQQAESLSENGFYDTESVIYYCHRMPEATSGLKRFVDENLKRLNGCITQNDWSGVTQFFLQIFELAKQTFYHPQKLKRLVVNLMFLMQGELSPHYPEHKDWLYDNEMFDQILLAPGISALETLIETYIKQLQQKSQSAAIAANHYPPIIEQSVQYLHQYYQNPSTNLNTVAQSIAVNRSYLSRLFLKETGVHFNAYLSELRLARARELLRSTSESVQSISELAGYGNAKYFISLFKKQEGITPTAYRLQASECFEKKEG